MAEELTTNVSGGNMLPSKITVVNKIIDVRPDTKNSCSISSEPITLYTPSKLQSNVSSTISSRCGCKKPSVYQYNMEKTRTDKRVSLNISPLGSTESFAKRVAYVLGRKSLSLKSGQTIYGFLNGCLSKSCGLIFPYTPQIQMTHNVNYDRTDITHSNLSISHYKNTPPPSISIEATFTADTRENALHMLSAIWFLRAVTKCDFGEQANVDDNCVAGMPPPILYLNGYNQIMDNIPVIIKSFNYSLPKDKDYVSLGINLDTGYFAYNDQQVYSSVDGTFYNNVSGNICGETGIRYINGIATSIDQLQNNVTTITSNRYNNYYFNNWLPTEMGFGIQLEIQPNLLKNKKMFNLNNYKMGLYNLDAYKGGSTVSIPTKNGLQDCTNYVVDVETTSIKEWDSIEYTKTKPVSYQSVFDKNDSRYTKNVQLVEHYNEPNFVQLTGGTYSELVPHSEVIDTNKQSISLSSSEKQKYESGVDIGSSQALYNFDKSGFTW